MHLNFEGFLNTLPILVYGMVGIFAVILLIALTVKLLSWVLPDRQDQ